MEKHILSTARLLFYFGLILFVTNCQVEKTELASPEYIVTQDSYVKFAHQLIPMHKWLSDASASLSAEDMQRIRDLIDRYKQKEDIDNDIKEFLTEKHLQGFHNLGNGIIKSFNDLVQDCPEIVSLNESEILRLIQLSFENGILPDNVFRPRIKKTDPALGPLQECIDDKYEIYYQETTINLTMLIVVSFFSVIIFGTTLGLTTSAIFTALFTYEIANTTAEQHFYEGIADCIALYGGGNPPPAGY